MTVGELKELLTSYNDSDTVDIEIGTASDCIHVLLTVDNNEKRIYRHFRDTLAVLEVPKKGPICSKKGEASWKPILYVR